MLSPRCFCVLPFFSFCERLAGKLRSIATLHAATEILTIPKATYEKHARESEYCGTVPTAITAPFTEYWQASFDRLKSGQVNIERNTKGSERCADIVNAANLRRLRTRILDVLCKIAACNCCASAAPQTSNRRASIADVQPITPVEQHILEQFDFDSKYGPCCGMTRMERNAAAPEHIHCDCTTPGEMGGTWHTTMPKHLPWQSGTHYTLLRRSCL